jgi:imidazolonepropionase-like amidohydrolase
MRKLACALLALAALATSAAAHPPAGHLAIRAGRTFDGVHWHDGLTVVLHGTQVKELRHDGSVPAGAQLIEAPDAVLTPGLIDLDSSLGLADGRDEWPEAVSPDLKVIDAFAPDAAELEALRRSGVTSAWLSPGPSGVLGGRGAWVQPGPPGEAARVLAPDWGPVGSLTAAGRLPNREPSSLPHQARMLEDALAPGFEGPARVRVDDAAGAARAARMPSVLLVGVPEDEAALREFAQVRGVIFSGVGRSRGRSSLQAPAQLASEGVTLGFGSDAALLGPVAIRHAAARAVQGGLDTDSALSALTGSAAGLGALPGARGTITRGAAADVVLWTGDPVEPASRALRVWVGGLEVHHD